MIHILCISRHTVYSVTNSVKIACISSPMSTFVSKYRKRATKTCIYFRGAQIYLKEWVWTEFISIFLQDTK